MTLAEKEKISKECVQKSFIPNGITSARIIEIIEKIGLNPNSENHLIFTSMKINQLGLYFTLDSVPSYKGMNIHYEFEINRVFIDPMEENLRITTKNYITISALRSILHEIDQYDHSALINEIYSINHGEFIVKLIDGTKIYLYERGESK